MINGILIEKTEESQTTALRQIEAEDLPEGDVLVDIAWSTLNYKDALAITGSSPVVRKFPMVPGIDFAGHQQKPAVYLFIGPTGVGKTTTLAKIAADCVISQRLNVGMITMDTYRVGGTEQLRQYADLLGVPLKVAFSATELKNYINRFEDKDVVFVDTPGRSQFDRTGINHIQDTLSKFGEPNSLLHVPANVRKQDAETIVSGYGQMNADSLIVTKADEATVCDGLPELCGLANIPVSYVTDGQRVPEDIKTASRDYIAKLAPVDNEDETDKEGKFAYDAQWC